MLLTRKWTWRKARNLKDLGTLTEPCPKCGRQTKIRDFNGVSGHKPMMCLDCDPYPSTPAEVPSK
jgi:hypothetical protein